MSRKILLVLLLLGAESARPAGADQEKEKSVEELIAQLKKGAPWDRTDAARKLGEMKCREAVAPLIELLKDKSEIIRDAAARALGMIGDAQAVEPLKQTIRKWPYCTEALEAIGRIGGEEQYKYLLEILESRKDKTLRAAAARGLGRLGDKRAKDALMKALRDDEVPIWMGAAKGLGYLGDRSVVDDLMKVLESKHPWASYGNAAACALGQLKEKRAVMTLIRQMQVPSGTDFPYYAAVALGWIGDKRAYKPLVALLESEDEFMRRCGIRGLRELGDKRALPALRKLLKDEVKIVRKQAKAVIDEMEKK